MAGLMEDPGNGINLLDSDPGTLSSGMAPCVPLTVSDVDEAARLYGEVFLADEPTTRFREPDPVMFHYYARLYVRSLAGKKLSFIAHDEKTHEPAGFLFSVDFTDDPKNDGEWMMEFLSQFPEIVTMIDELEERYLDCAAILPGSVLHIFQIGVDRKYRGHGVAQAMIRRVLVHARKLGFRQVIADCTHPASRRSFEQCGFHEAGFLSYDTFSMNGVRFFAGLEGGISLMVRDI
jgi:ribosomal protein S18 acetylase RimI-like enzyme